MIEHKFKIEDLGIRYIQSLLKLINPALGTKIRIAWLEYEEGKTAESRFIREMEMFECMEQIVSLPHQLPSYSLPPSQYNFTFTGSLSGLSNFNSSGSSSSLSTSHPFSRLALETPSQGAVESASRLRQPSLKNVRKCHARRASQEVSRRILMLGWMAKAFAWLSFPTNNPDTVNADMLNRSLQFHTPLLLYPSHIARSLRHNGSNTIEPFAGPFF